MNKDFDCVEMKRRGAELVYQRVKDMTREEELAYWQQRTAELLAAQQKARDTKDNAPAKNG